MIDLNYYDDGKQLRMVNTFAESVRAKIHEVIYPTNGGQQMSVDITKMLFNNYEIRPKADESAGHCMGDYKGDQLCYSCGYLAGCECPSCKEKKLNCPKKGSLC